MAVSDLSTRRSVANVVPLPMHFLPRIESLRGIAALTVVGYHVWGGFSDKPVAGWDSVAFHILQGLSNGIGAVVAFFVISGFVLARSLDANPTPLRFFRNRIFRMFPAAIVVISLLTALYHWFGIYVMYQGDFRPLNVLLNMLLIRTDINAVMWSMKVECFATPLILFSAWLAKRNETPWLWGTIAILFALSFWGPYIHLLGDATNLAPLYAFVVGVLAHRYERRLVDCPRAVATFAAFFSIVLFCYCGTRKQTAPVLMLECLCSAWLVMACARQPLALFCPLDVAVIRFYGRISYSFYLLHVLGILLASRILSATGASLSSLPVSVGAVAMTALSILVTTPVAYLFWRFIEVPGIAAGRTFFAYPDRPVPAAAK
jgi:exopolysaccharide production protein ExoZ